MAFRYQRSITLTPRCALKSEQAWGRRFSRPREEARRDVFNYIEIFYNSRRQANTARFNH
ncbi:hypothetical protein NYA30BAC_00423 [Halomonas sp. NYA30]